MKPNFSSLLLLGSIILLCSCEAEKSTQTVKPDGNAAVQRNKANPEDLVEIYMPDVDKPYDYMRTRLISLFDSGNSSNINVALDEGIWLMEGGLNELLLDSAYAFPDSAHTEEVVTSQWVDAPNDSLSAATLEQLFRNHYQETDDYLGNHADYEGLLVDVGLRGRRYDGEVKITITSYLGLHPKPYDDPYDAPNVPPAQDDKYVAAKGFCSGGPASTSAWWDVTTQVRAVLPQVIGPIFPGPGSRHNVFTLWANVQQLNGIEMDGEYLPNGTNPLYQIHYNITSPTVCVTASQQDDYAQVTADELANLVAKRHVWDGIKSFNMYRNGFNWAYLARAVKTYHPTGNDPVLTTGDLDL